MPGGEVFDDITLEIRSLGDGGFETRLQAEALGEAAGPFAMRLDSEKLQPLLKVFQAVPNGTAIPDAREVGATLFDALFREMSAGSSTAAALGRTRRDRWGAPAACTSGSR